MNQTITMRYLKGSKEINSWWVGDGRQWDVYGLPNYPKGPATMSLEGLKELGLIKGAK